MKKGNKWGLLPILVYLILFFSSAIITQDFYAMPAIVAFLIALIVALIQHQELNFNDKLKIMANSLGDENIITMCLIFLCAGAFSGVVSASGGASSTVNLCLSLIPPSFTIIGLFIIGCFISIAMGTSMGTIAALAPIAIGISEHTSFSLGICIGAVLCGAMFGDNLSMISDTTIAAVKTQGCEMKDKFKENFLIVLPAAIITIIIFYFQSRNINCEVNSESYNILLVIPYLYVLIGALRGTNVFTLLISGTIISAILGIICGTLELNMIFKCIGEGINGMYDITIISIIVSCLVALMREYGGIDYVLSFIHRRIKTKKQAQLGIASLALLADVCCANNTVSILVSGSIAKQIGNEYQISNKRCASLLDIFASVGQGIIPYGAQLLSAASLCMLTPFDIMPYLYYPILMAISALCCILFKKS